MPNRNKLIASLTLSLLVAACSNEVDKKEFTKGSTTLDCTQLTVGSDYFCLSEALKDVQPIATACAGDAQSSAACGKSRFFFDGYGGYVYPVPVLEFFNGLYAEYVTQIYNQSTTLPTFKHFGEVFGLIYNDDPAAETLDQIDLDAMPVGIVSGGTLALDGANVEYKSESCAMCHFDQARDGYFRYGLANGGLKYGALKLAMTKFVCYVEDTDRYAELKSECDASDENLSADCKTFLAFVGSRPISSLLGVWNGARISDDVRSQLLSDLQSKVPGARSACDAVEQMTGTVTDDQVIELAKWDGVGNISGAVDASRMDRFYGSVTTSAGVSTRAIDDNVHAPVKIPHLGNLVSENAADASGAFLGSGVIGSLEQYVRMHVALVGGDNTATGVQDAALVGLTTFLRELQLPQLHISDDQRTQQEKDLIATGRAAFVARGCADCHDVDNTDDAVVQYPQLVGTDFSYAYMLGGNIDHPTPDLTPADTWNKGVGGLKTPHLQGLWAYNAFLHNGTAYNLESLFCIDGMRPFMDGDNEPVFEAPLLDDGHFQTCLETKANGALDFSKYIDEDERRAMIAYLKTL